MAESTDNPTELARKTWKRRGLFAAAWATVAGIVLKRTAAPVEAATANVVYDTTGPGSLPNDVGSTVLLEPGATLPASGPVLQVQSVTNNPTTLIQAVVGLVGSPGTAVNAIAGGSGVAVDALSYSGIGVRGQIPQSSSSDAIAVYGVNASAYTGSVAGTGGWGVVGVSRYGHGVLGATSANGAGAVVGNAYGIAGAWAGIFFGPAIVEGNFTVLGGAKSAAVPHPDGTHRRLYCVESPESWFEDFGKGQLTCGQADVPLDPDFAAVVDLEDYHVFLTAYDADHLLHVTNQTKAGFRVQAQHEVASGRFSWRVVAKRKDIASLRFEPVVVPPKPEMPTIPDPPTIPTPPVIRRHR